jgi:nitrile hydratase beta subunit
MNGPHDMGGFTRFGPVNPEKNEPVFHEDWERKVLALCLAMDASGLWNADVIRHTRESMPALKYWSSSYYDIRVEGHISQMVKHGLITEAELAAGRAQVPPGPMKSVSTAAEAPAVLARGSPYTRSTTKQARFAKGDKVQALKSGPAGHTRLPRYARGKHGEIMAIHGAFVFPDSSAERLGDDPQWLYTVRFTARELWGHDNGDANMIDLWEPYLEPA